MSNSPRGQRRQKAEKQAKKREAVPLGSGAIFLPDRKNTGTGSQKPPLGLQYNNQFNVGGSERDSNSIKHIPYSSKAGKYKNRDGSQRLI